MARTVSCALVPLLVFAACGDVSTDPSPPRTSTLSIELVADGFIRPLFVGAPPRDPRLFVVERAGRILTLRDGVVAERPFLDLTAEVSTLGNERGMLGLAFHPRFATNRRFFVSYVDLEGAIRLVQFTASASDPSVADPASRVNIRRIPHTGILHYGGMIQFLSDGTLLMSVGDAGSANAQGGDSQRPSTLRGKLIRLDVDPVGGGAPFAIPADNPFITDESFRPEVFSLGLRNPWRFWYDAPTRQLFVADVGEGSYEELNVLTVDEAAGANFGWSFLEGPACLPTSATCSVDRLVMPDVAYQHGPGCNSITGGVVYRGLQHPEHSGRYFYSDFCQGWLRSLRAMNGTVSEEIEWSPTTPVARLTSFGVDGRGEVYAVSLLGQLYRIGGGSR
jgi:glucose/arabinose dehydrogenase